MKERGIKSYAGLLGLVLSVWISCTGFADDDPKVKLREELRKFPKAVLKDIGLNAKASDFPKALRDIEKTYKISNSTLVNLFNDFSKKNPAASTDSHLGDIVPPTKPSEVFAGEAFDEFATPEAKPSSDSSKVDGKEKAEAAKDTAAKSDDPKKEEKKSALDNPLLLASLLGQNNPFNPNQNQFQNPNGLGGGSGSGGGLGGLGGGTPGSGIGRGVGNDPSQHYQPPDFLTDARRRQREQPSRDSNRNDRIRDIPTSSDNENKDKKPSFDPSELASSLSTPKPDPSKVDDKKNTPLTQGSNDSKDAALDDLFNSFDTKENSGPTTLQEAPSVGGNDVFGSSGVGAPVGGTPVGAMGGIAGGSGNFANAASDGSYIDNIKVGGSGSVGEGGGGGKGGYQMVYRIESGEGLGGGTDFSGNGPVANEGGDVSLLKTTKNSSDSSSNPLVLPAPKEGGLLPTYAGQQAPKALVKQVCDDRPDLPFCVANFPEKNDQVSLMKQNGV